MGEAGRRRQSERFTLRYAAQAYAALCLQMADHAGGATARVAGVSQPRPVIAEGL